MGTDDFSPEWFDSPAVYWPAGSASDGRGGVLPPTSSGTAVLCYFEAVTDAALRSEGLKVPAGSNAYRAFTPDRPGVGVDSLWVCRGVTGRVMADPKRGDGSLYATYMTEAS